MQTNRWWLSAVVLTAFCGAAADAQEFRIFTVVSLENPNAPSAKPDVVARSLTVFHAGKVYDYIDTVGEVIVLEPAQHRFLILNPARDMATSIAFDELTNLLKVAKLEIASYVTRLEKDGDEKAMKTASQLRFQLSPKFDETWDEKGRRLTLSSPYLKYSALCAVEPAPSDILATWTRYVDSMSRLNYILHPGSLYPESRLAVNASIAKHGRLPVEVELMTETDTKAHLRARHQIHWELDAKDRSLIHEWESLIKKKNSQLMTFKDYQRATLLQTGKQK